MPNLSGGGLFLFFESPRLSRLKIGVDLF